MIANYLIHLRPKSFLPSFIFTLTGYAINPNKGSLASIPIEILCLFLVYSVCLFGGTCALNSHFDKDDGPLNFLENPPEKPQFLGHFGLVIMLLGCLISWFLGFWPFLMSLTSVILSIVYSIKFPGLAWRGKEVGVLDNLINALGCGLVGVLLGATLGGHSPTHAMISLGLAFTISVAGSYPATQIFQLKATDSYSKARNFTTFFGPAKALKIGSILLVLGQLLANFSQFVFFDFQSNFLSLALFCAFNVIFFLGVIQMWAWSTRPFESTKKKYKNLVTTLLSARLVWIISEWLLV